MARQFSQFTGSFKERGARNALLLLTEEEKRRGVMAARSVPLSHPPTLYRWLDSPTFVEYAPSR